MNIIFPDSVKKYVEMQTNSNLALYTDMPEAYYLHEYFKELCPSSVMELGCGVGRASVYLFKKYGWGDAWFYLCDGNTAEKRYKGMRENDGEFYNSGAATQEFCLANGLEQHTFVDLGSQPLPVVPVGIDLVYSFLAIGFHWPLSLYIDKIYPLCAKGAIVAFGIRTEPDVAWISKQIGEIKTDHYKILDLKLCPRETRRSVLVLEVL